MGLRTTTALAVLSTSTPNPNSHRQNNVEPRAHPTTLPPNRRNDNDEHKSVKNDMEVQPISETHEQMGITNNQVITSEAAPILMKSIKYS